MSKYRIDIQLNGRKLFIVLLMYKEIDSNKSRDAALAPEEVIKSRVCIDA